MVNSLGWRGERGRERAGPCEWLALITLRRFPQQPQPVRQRVLRLFLRCIAVVVSDFLPEERFELDFPTTLMILRGRVGPWRITLQESGQCTICESTDRHGARR
jgi:hypothetical protein